MDFLNKAFAQLGDLFRSMTPGARITAALLLGVILVSLVYLFNYQTSGSGAYLMGGQMFSADDLNRMLPALGKAGLTADVEGNRIRIPRGQEAAYMAALAEDKALPANFETHLEEALSKQGLFENGDQQEKRMQIAKQNYWGLVLGNWPGVDEAVVTYDESKKAGFSRGRVATASVTVFTKGGAPLDRVMAQTIREAVAAGYANLSPQQVVVTDARNSRNFGGGGDGGSGGGLDNSYFTTTMEYKRQFEETISEALSRVPGVTVSASVLLSKEVRHTTDSVKIDPKPVTVMSIDESTDVRNETAGPGGRPGLAANVANPNGAASLANTGKTTTNTENRTSGQVQSVPSTDHVKIETAGLTPERVSVAVGVPNSYFVDIWREANPPADGADPTEPTPADLTPVRDSVIKDITQHVASLLPPVAGVTDPSELVTVTPFADLAVEEIQPAGITEKTLTWFGAHWSTLGMFGLALFGLVMLRSMVRAVPNESPSPVLDFGVAPEPAGEGGSEEARAKSNRFKRRPESGPSLRDELLEVVNEDPDAAANILRGWIGNMG